MATKKTKVPNGYSYYKDKGHFTRTVVVHLSEETYGKLKWKAYLEERSIQKTTRRLVEEGLKDVEPPKEKGTKA